MDVRPGGGRIMTATRYVREIDVRLRSRVAEGFEATYGGDSASAPNRVGAMLAPLLEHEAQECFGLLTLDAKHRVTGWRIISRGTLTSSLVHPREVFRPAIALGAAAVIVTHNHPSGDPEPSVEDVHVTARLCDAGRLLGIPVLDHVIIGAAGRWTSLRARGVGGFTL